MFTDLVVLLWYPYDFNSYHRNAKMVNNEVSYLYQSFVSLRQNGVHIYFSLGDVWYLLVILEYCNCHVCSNAAAKLQAKGTTA